MSRVYNFSAGPAVLPEEVLKEAAEEMLDYNGTGMSVMEMSHRSQSFQEIIDTAEADLRELMGIPDNYKVLFLQGGESQQFAMVPMNLMKNKVADYIVTGQWAKKAAAEAKNTERSISWHPQRIRHSPISRIALIFPFQKMRTMCTYVRIIPSMAPNTRNFRIPRERPWLPMYHLLPVRADGCDPVWPDMRRGAEEHRSGRNRDRDHPGRPDYRGCASRDAYHAPV